MPNGNFEDTLRCPLGLDDLSATKYWYKPNGGSAEYFNTCSGISSDVGVPQNLFGYQNARSGNAYAGWAVSFNPFEPNYREYLQVQLSSALITGKKYFVSAYLARADSMPMALKNIGIALTDSSDSSTTGTTIYYTPQVIYSSFLTDTDWVEISDTIIAVGGEKYLTIGYFKDDNSSDTINLFNSLYLNYYAYYYTDDVSVTCLDCPVGIYDASIDKKIKIYPNPSPDFINVSFGEVEVNKLTLFNSIGQTVFTIYKNNFKSKNSLVINLTSLSKGVYFLKIENEKFSMVKKIFLINN